MMAGTVPSAGPRVLPLRCTACGSDLPAASHDVAFRCPQCGRGWEIAAGALSERRSFYLPAPPRTPDELIYLPYWSFTASCTVTPGEVRGPDRVAANRAEKLRRVWVAAYSIHRPTYVGEWALAYTRIQPDWEPRAGHGPASPGAALATSDARMLAEHYLLSEIDRAADLSTFDVTVELGEPELWAIPCVDMGASLRCPWTRAEVPAAALNDLAEIRQAPGERRGA